MKELLNRMAVPCRDDGRKFTDDARLKAIACELVGTQWRVWRSDSLCRIYAREGFDPMKPTLVFSSHVDMVAQRCYADCQGDVWRGSFDNLITNAALVWDMREDLFGPQVLVAFTGDEEEDSHGADQVARILKGHGIPVQFIIATDVTEEGWNEEKSFTIENILPDEGQDVADALCWMLPLVLDLDPAPKVIVEGEADEAWEYDEFDFPCCSVCLPCHGEMHSERGVVVRAESVAKFAVVLDRLGKLVVGSSKKIGGCSSRIYVTS